MSEKSKGEINYFVLSIPVFIVLIAVANHLSFRNDEVFAERNREDHQICLQRAERDSVDARWCDEISKSAKLAYYQSSRSNKTYLLLAFILPLSFALVIGFGKLRKQVEELKEKIDV